MVSSNRFHTMIFLIFSRILNLCWCLIAFAKFSFFPHFCQCLQESLIFFKRMICWKLFLHFVWRFEISKVLVYSHNMYIMYIHFIFFCLPVAVCHVSNAEPTHKFIVVQFGCYLKYSISKWHKCQQEMLHIITQLSDTITFPGRWLQHNIFSHNICLIILSDTLAHG